MFAVVYSFAYAFLIALLSASVPDRVLSIIGFIGASWMAFAGAIAGWQRFKK